MQDNTLCVSIWAPALSPSGGVVKVFAPWAMANSVQCKHLGTSSASARAPAQTSSRGGNKH
eukprot:12072980-Karenia_brevis.AAC.1